MNSHPASDGCYPVPSQAIYPLLWQALDATDPAAKCTLVRDLARRWRAGELSRRDGAAQPEPNHPVRAGVPAELRFVAPARVPQRGVGSAEGRVHLYHAVTHIEFTSINLALDAAWRFRDLPDAYLDDWLSVAREEVSHFEMLQTHLLGLGSHYGALPVHDGLWRIALATSGDVLERMALVPRFLEARGLDVNPGMQRRLAQVGDTRGVEMLEIILRDEVGHVARGDRWFRWLCEQRGLSPEPTYRALVERHAGWPRPGAIHCTARRRAGFGEDELRALGCTDDQPTTAGDRSATRNQMA